MTHVDAQVRWICSNPDCGWSFLTPQTEMENPPFCPCGGVMEKVETIPVFAYLDFLRGDPYDEHRRHPAGQP